MTSRYLPAVTPLLLRNSSHVGRALCDSNCRRLYDPVSPVMLDMVHRRASEFDINFHIDYLHFPLFRSSATNTLTTLHGRLDLPFLVPAFSEFPEMPLVSISDDQRKPVAWANWISTVYHGLPNDLLRYRESPSLDYLAFLGRISPEKRVDRAVEIARRAE